MTDTQSLKRPPADGDEAIGTSDERYISTREAATLLGVNRATVINWARQGRFGAIQYGSRGIYRFDRREIVHFLNKSRLRFSDGADTSRRAADD
ncbi:MAG: hypothetical protein AVDCRST_MAG88-3632 [uncultured Thermomicrobiales bacterium]|uniref:Helix-turn-helix domain-containing protein n=1 Tax=uncultured Thermomicrobiales bacterium TaxID=1645740 RepID=A0A6J4VS94_9BACT|nr:MAG: hypothetical protein AVDCRST_MAG88-3632 [uncultured Thermomicrobiales bacterium]